MAYFWAIAFHGTTPHSNKSAIMMHGGLQIMQITLSFDRIHRQLHAPRALGGLSALLKVMDLPRQPLLPWRRAPQMRHWMERLVT